MALDPVTDQFSQFLRLAFFRSPNFLTGVSGWTINQDGSAEFNNVTVRGTVTAGHFIGTGNGLEIVIYRGTPAAGNVLASLISSQTTDSFGNALLAGLTLYNNIGAPLTATRIQETGISYYTAATQAGPWAIQASINYVTAGPLLTVGGTTPLSIVPQISGPLILANEAAPAGVAAAGQLFAIAGQLGQVNASGQTGRLSSAKLAAVAPATVTQAALTNLFNDTIKANDAQVGSIYKVTAFGFGAWGATQQNLTFGLRFGATDATTIGTTPVISGTALAASATFRWKVEIELVCVTTGAGATWVANMSGCVTQNVNVILPGTAADNTIPFAAGTGSGTVTLDSTVDEILGLSASWASTTGAPTLTRVAGWLERIA